MGLPAVFEQQVQESVRDSSLSGSPVVPREGTLPLVLLSLQKRSFSSSLRNSSSGGSSGSSSNSSGDRMNAGSALERLKGVRALLQQQQIDALLVEDADAHGSEIPAHAFARRSFLTSFDGSYGTALVTPHEALLWTDGRQAPRRTKPQNRAFSLPTLNPARRTCVFSACVVNCFVGSV
ncbi:hypothetical protein Esti_005743 [Eimeria stiedai]